MPGPARTADRLIERRPIEGGRRAVPARRRTWPAHRAAPRAVAAARPASSPASGRAASRGRPRGRCRQRRRPTARHAAQRDEPALACLRRDRSSGGRRLAGRVGRARRRPPAREGGERAFDERLRPAVRRPPAAPRLRARSRLPTAIAPAAHQPGAGFGRPRSIARARATRARSVMSAPSAMRPSPGCSRARRGTQVSRRPKSQRAESRMSGALGRHGDTTRTACGGST